MLLGWVVYADAALAITAELEGVFQHAFTQGDVEMAAIVDIANEETVSGFEVGVEWVRFDKEDNTWKKLAKIWDAALQSVKSELRKLR